MLSKKQTIALIAIIVTVIISEVILSFISQSSFHLSSKAFFMLSSLEINNAEEYHGTFSGYEDTEQLVDIDADEDVKRIVKYPVVQYQTSDGQVKTVTSRLTDAERGRKLEDDVIVLDNGSDAVILQDRLDLKRALMKSIICDVLMIAIIIIAIIPVIVIAKKALKNRASDSPVD